MMASIWNLISNETLADLMRLQHKHYPGVKLESPEELKQDITVTGNIEDIEEIDRLIRIPPHYIKGDDFHG